MSSGWMTLATTNSRAEITSRFCWAGYWAEFVVGSGQRMRVSVHDPTAITAESPDGNIEAK